MSVSLRNPVIDKKKQNSTNGDQMDSRNNERSERRNCYSCSGRYRSSPNDKK